MLGEDSLPETGMSSDEVVIQSPFAWEKYAGWLLLFGFIWMLGMDDEKR